MYATLNDRRALQNGLLFAKPGNDIISPTTGRARPPHDFRVLAFLSNPPVFLDHHQGPAAFASAGERENFHGESVLLTSKAVPLARTIDAVEGPLRTLEA